MKKSLNYLFAFLLFNIGCQETIDPPLSETDNCSDAFEFTNNKLSTATWQPQSEWIDLAVKDKDFWRIKVKANDKGVLPTKVTYTLLDPAHVYVIVWRQDTVLAGPQTAHTYRPDISNYLLLPDLKEGDILTFQINLASDKRTCYAVKLN